MSHLYFNLLYRLPVKSIKLFEWNKSQASSKIHSNHPITTNALEGMKVVDIIERIYNLKKRG